MSAKIKGLKELERKLEKRFEKKAMQRISDGALKAGAKVFVEELKRQFNAVNWKGYETGATIEEITISEPMTIKGVRTVKVHWKGPNNRYALVHLNEWGTVKNPNPPAKGTIARALKNAEKAYRNAIKEAIVRGL
ncbi:HK97-gp10 family putative phage morphogenesis protein [Oceanobacillus caeni]